MIPAQDNPQDRPFDMLADQSIAVSGTIPDQVFDTLVAAAAARHDLPYKFMREKLAQQSARTPVVLGDGVALVHLRMPRLSRPFTIVGHADRPVPLPDDEGDATLFVLTVSPYRDVAGHLQRLARLTRLLRDRDVLAHLRDAGQPATVLHSQAA